MEHSFVLIKDRKLLNTKSSNYNNFSIAKSLTTKLRKSLDYQGIARKVIHVEQLPQGALPVYDKDIDVTSCIIDTVNSFKHKDIVINSRGKLGRRGVFARRVTIPQFEVVQFPTVNIKDIKSRRFSLMDRHSPNYSFEHKSIIINSKGKLQKPKYSYLMSRAVQKARQEIMAQEDAAIFDILDNLGK